MLLPWAVASTAALLALHCGRSQPAPRAEPQPPGLAAEPAGAPNGKWRKARTIPDAKASEAAAQLQAVPYLGAYHAASKESGVVRFDSRRAFRGLNLFTSGHAPEAILMTMEGKVLRRWHASIAEVFPDLARNPQVRKFDFWRRAWLYPNGDLLAIFDGHGLVKLDRSSKVLWAKAGGFHHDLEVAADGTIFVLDREGKLIPRVNPTLGVLEDFITVLAPDGTQKDRISLLEALEGSPHAVLLKGMNDHGDIFHTNTLELLDGRLAGQIPAFKAGNILVSVLQLDALAVIDPVQRKAVWAMRGAWKRQHQPTVLDNGHLLLFDNVGLDRDHSRVLEIDPHDGAVVWQYGSTDGHELSSRTLGTAQRPQRGHSDRRGRERTSHRGDAHRRDRLGIPQPLSRRRKERAGGGGVRDAPPAAQLRKLTRRAILQGPAARAPAVGERVEPRRPLLAHRGFESRTAVLELLRILCQIVVLTGTVTVFDIALGRHPQPHEGRRGQALFFRIAKLRRARGLFGGAGRRVGMLEQDRLTPRRRRGARRAAAPERNERSSIDRAGKCPSRKLGERRRKIDVRGQFRNHQTG